MKKSINMTSQLLPIYYALFIIKLNNAYKTCFQESNDINYLFINDTSQIKIPLLPLNCYSCQSAHQVRYKKLRLFSFY